MICSDVIDSTIVISLHHFMFIKVVL